jgi:hypothetical protein
VPSPLGNPAPRPGPSLAGVVYRGGRPNGFARLQNRVSAIAFATGIWPKRAAALEVRGRRTGRDISFPVVIAEGER